jgi:hypothetical protein
MRPRMTGGQKAIALLISPSALIALVGWGALTSNSVGSPAPEITGQIEENAVWRGGGTHPWGVVNRIKENPLHLVRRMAIVKTDLHPHTVDIIRP